MIRINQALGLSLLVKNDEANLRKVRARPQGGLDRRGKIGVDGVRMIRINQALGLSLLVKTNEANLRKVRAWRVGVGSGGVERGVQVICTKR